MSDRYQSLVSAVEPAAAERVARRLREHMLALKILGAACEDCTYGEEAYKYRPGERYQTVVDAAATNLVLELHTNGVGFRFGREPVITAGSEYKATCPRCQREVDVGGAFFDAVGPWYNSDDASSVCCASCGVATRLVDWPIVPPWGLGNVVVTFWNWPPLRPSFVDSLASLAGASVVCVAGKL